MNEPKLPQLPPASPHEPVDATVPPADGVPPAGPDWPAAPEGWADAALTADTPPWPEAGEVDVDVALEPAPGDSQIMVHPALAATAETEPHAGGTVAPANSARRPTTEPTLEASSATTPNPQNAPSAARRGALVWFLAGAAIVAVIALLATVLVRTLPGDDTVVLGAPEVADASAAVATVEGYLQSLVDGDAEAALALWGPNVTTAERALLRDDVYLAAEDRPSSFEVGETGSPDAHGVVAVDASLTIDGKSYDVPFGLEPVDDTGDAWQIVTGPVQSIAVGDVTGVTRVNGVAVDLSEPVAELAVLPGTYVFESPDGGGVYAFGDDQRAQALPGIDTTLAGFTAAWSAEAQQSAIDQAWAHIDSCLQSDQFVPLYCPNTLIMKDPVTVAVTNIDRTWSLAPSITFEVRDSGAVVRIEGGEMRIDFEQRRTEADRWVANSLVDRAPWGGATAIELPVTVGPDGRMQVDTSAF